jgi:hypothetical protein
LEADAAMVFIASFEASAFDTTLIADTGFMYRACVAHQLFLSFVFRVRRQASRPHWIERVQCNEACLDVIALGAFEQSVFETDWSRRNAFQHHLRLATRTTRSLNSSQESLGYGHDVSLRWGRSIADSL